MKNNSNSPTPICVAYLADIEAFLLEVIPDNDSVFEKLKVFLSADKQQTKALQIINELAQVNFKANPALEEAMWEGFVGALLHAKRTIVGINKPTIPEAKSPDYKALRSMFKKLSFHKDTCLKAHIVVDNNVMTYFRVAAEEVTRLCWVVSKGKMVTYNKLNNAEEALMANIEGELIRRLHKVDIAKFYKDFENFTGNKLQATDLEMLSSFFLNFQQKVYLKFSVRLKYEDFKTLIFTHIINKPSFQPYWLKSANSLKAVETVINKYIDIQ